MFYALTGLINAISCSILGLLVYSKDRKNPINKTFGIFCFFMAFWSWFYFFWQISGTERNALFFSRTLMAGAIFIPVSYLYFVFAFIETAKKRVLKFFIFSGYFISFFFFICNFTPWFVTDVRPRLGFKFWPSAGPLFGLFLLIWFFYAFYSIFLLVKMYKSSTGVKKHQLNYVLAGTIIGYFGGATNFFLWYDIPIPPIGNWMITLYIFLIAYAILKYHLMNIKLLLTELLVAIIALTLLIQTIISKSTYEGLYQGALFAAFCFLGYLLIRSVINEVKRREESEKLTVEIKKAYDLEKEARRKIQELGEAKTQFIMATQHHLRTPLVSMMGYTDLILAGSYGKIPLKIKEAILKLQTSTNRLIKIVNELLDISQFQLGKKVVSLRPNIEIEPILKEIIEELQFTAQTKGFYLKLEKPIEKLPTIEADPEKLKVALANIFDNGIKYTTQGGITIKVQILGKKLRITSQDTGMGVPKEDMKALFMGIFERGEEAKKIFTTGRGIGLYISSKIIEAHNGKIWAESEGSGRGTTFFIEMPVS